MEKSVIFYIVCAIMLGAGVTISFVQSGRTMAAIIFLIGAVLTFVFFGIRWFEDGVMSGSKTGSWPPVINTCPDFLVETTRTVGTGPSAKKVRACIDTIGISRNGLMTKWPGTAPSGANADSYYFDLEVTAGNEAERMNTLCKNAIDKGLTWEGVTDGQICFATGVAGGVPGGAVICSPA